MCVSGYLVLRRYIIGVCVCVLSGVRGRAVSVLCVGAWLSVKRSQKVFQKEKQRGEREKEGSALEKLVKQ